MMLSTHTYIVSDGVISLGREFQMFGSWKRTVKYSATIHLPPRPAVSYSVSLTSSCLMPYRGTCATNNEKPVEGRHMSSARKSRFTRGIVNGEANASALLEIALTEVENQQQTQHNDTQRNAGQYITTFHLTASHLRANTLVCCKRPRGWVQQWRYAQSCTLMRWISCMIDITRCPLSYIFTKTQIMLSNMKYDKSSVLHKVPKFRRRCISGRKWRQQQTGTN